MLDQLYEELKNKILDILWDSQLNEVVFITDDNTSYTASRMYDELLVDSPLSKEFIALAIEQAQRSFPR